MVWTVTKAPVVLHLAADLGEHILEWGLAEICVLGLGVVCQLEHLVDVAGRVLLDLDVHRRQGYLVGRWGKVLLELEDEALLARTRDDLLVVEHSSVAEDGVLAEVRLDSILVDPEEGFVDGGAQGLEGGGLVVDLGLDDIADHAEDTEVGPDSANDLWSGGRSEVVDVEVLGVLPGDRCDHVVEDWHVGGEDGCSGWSSVNVGPSFDSKVRILLHHHDDASEGRTAFDPKTRLVLSIVAVEMLHPGGVATGIERVLLRLVGVDSIDLAILDRLLGNVSSGVASREEEEEDVLDSLVEEEEEAAAAANFVGTTGSRPWCESDVAGVRATHYSDL